MYVADTDCDDDKRLLHGGIDEAGVAIDAVADESDMSLAIGSAAAAFLVSFFFFDFLSRVVWLRGGGL